MGKISVGYPMAEVLYKGAFGKVDAEKFTKKFFSECNVKVSYKKAGDPYHIIQKVYDNGDTYKNNGHVPLMEVEQKMYPYGSDKFKENFVKITIDDALTGYRNAYYYKICEVIDSISRKLVESAKSAPN